MESSFQLSDYEARRDLVRLDGSKIELPKTTCLARYISDHRKKTEARLVRITRSDKGGWDVSDRLGEFYLAGPMRGYPMFNFPAFLMAARVLQARGLKILSPAEKDLEMGFDPSRADDQNFDIGEAFRWDFHAVARSKGTILLPNWEHSAGAKAERLVAQLCEREVYLLDMSFNLVEAPPMDYHLSWTDMAKVLPAPSPSAAIEEPMLDEDGRRPY